MAIDVELESLYHADKTERELSKDGKDSARKIEIHDSQRLARVKEILPRIDTTEVWNCHYLALLFLHGETVDDYEKAHTFATKAVEMGSNVTKWLYAATLDRWLVAQGKLQKFGTQCKKIDGKWEVFPVDTTISDAKRGEYGVPPLTEILRTISMKYH